MKKVIRTGSLFLSIFAFFIMSYVTYLDYDIPDSFYVYKDEKLNIYEHSSILTKENTSGGQVRVEANMSATKTAQLKILGAIPVKTVYLNNTSEKYVVPCGTPFGIKMLTAGVVVVGLSPIETEKGSVSPAQKAGIKEGDIILSLDGQEISSYTDLARKINSTQGEKISVKLKRKGKEMNVSLVPAKSASDGVYRCGFWVRDSSAGIGTVTYYDPVSGKFGGLGHPVCDVDTGEILPLSSGEVVPVTILDAVKGVAGEPGELRGTFISNSVSGKLYNNTQTGVYGQLKNKPVENKEIPVSLKQDIKVGKAEIYSTVSGTKPESYEVEIEKINLNNPSPTKNMVVKITDPNLLEKTGGIVQGMSGSPIVQNGRLVGAITHVFVNDPTRGYGIFIENMLETAA